MFVKRNKKAKILYPKKEWLKPKKIPGPKYHGDETHIKSHNITIMNFNRLIHFQQVWIC
jgi:hypothetical protein